MARTKAQNSSSNNRKRVTISTVTANRRRFFEHTIRNVTQQLLSGYDVEWIVVEDGEESVEDLLRNITFVRYKRLEGKSSVARKRNIANSMSTGDFIVYFDDDNYAFPHRINVAVQGLENSTFLIAGSSDMLVFDGRNWQIFQVGPFSDMHATLGTWCIKRELLNFTKFEDLDTSGEEVAFTRNWTLPFLQLGALNTSISFSHAKNTVVKRDLREPWTPIWSPETFITCTDTLEFYRSVVSEDLKTT